LHSLFDSEVFKFLVVIILATLASLRLVDCSNDWIANALQFLHLLFKGVFVCVIVGVEPVFGFSESFGNGVLALLFQLVSQLILIFDGVAHLIDVVLECVLRVNAFLDLLVFVGEFLCVEDHLLDLILGETALVICDRDVFLLSGSLLNTANGQDRVLVDFESDFDLGNTPCSGRNT